MLGSIRDMDIFPTLVIPDLEFPTNDGEDGIVGSTSSSTDPSTCLCGNTVETGRGNLSDSIDRWCLENSTGCRVDESFERHYWALFLLLFPLLTLFGNVLVCLSVFRERSLQTMTNYLIVSLAVADIMVAILVMPFAVYVEVNQSNWLLGDALCDMWVACDVMGCTASILNLTSISIDRYIAVTYPVSYARHKNSKRVYGMLALTWAISLAISSPIPLGMNYTERRTSLPAACTFYNSDFIIYSSMGSFYIPCIAMLVLYWRILCTIRRRGRNSGASSRIPVPTGAGNGVGEPTNSHAPSSESADIGTPGQTQTKSSRAPAVCTKVPFTIVEEQEDCNSSSLQRNQSEDDDDASLKDIHGWTLEMLPTPCLSINSSENKAPTSSFPSMLLLVSPHAEEIATEDYAMDSDVTQGPISSRKGAGRKEASSNKAGNRGQSFKKLATNMRVAVNVRLAMGRARKERNANRRERKVTKTLAIVLGVFLLCWVPFFTINITNAICIRYNLFEEYKTVCEIDPVVFSLFVWLGYINSFLNPVIYTIFNIEFRRAFKKILRQPCARRF